MKIAILHEELEWTEKEFERILSKKDVEIKMLNITKNNLKDILDFNPNLVLNRIYASVANRNYQALSKTLSILKYLEEEGIKIINSYSASKVDYDKFYAFNLMKLAGINTANTILYQEKSNLKKVVNKLRGFPIIVKRNTGGRGLDIVKCNDLNEIKLAIKNIKNSKDYFGGIILQEFLESIKPQDYRVWVLNGEVLFYHGRSLISQREEEAPWLASRSFGSKILSINKNIPVELKEFSIKAAKSVGVTLDVMDIILTKEGYKVIEHNATPNLREEYEVLLGFNIVEKLIDKIISKRQIEPAVLVKNS